MLSAPTVTSPVTSSLLSRSKPRIGADALEGVPNVNEPTVWTPFVMIRPPLLP